MTPLEHYELGEDGYVGHTCCWHPCRGTLILAPGFVQEECCRCRITQIVHAEHGH